MTAHGHAEKLVSANAPLVSATSLLRDLQALLESQGGAEKISLRVLVVSLQRQSFTLFLLLFSLLMVSPLSAIPGATTVMGLTVASILAQQVLSRERVWLPAILLERSLPVARVLQAVIWLQRPVGWLETHLRKRMAWVFLRPMSSVAPSIAFCAALCSPLMEVIPGSATSVGAAMTLYAAGTLARDGMFVLIGASLAAILPVTLWLILT
jgi:hypothetical protein